MNTPQLFKTACVLCAILIACTDTGRSTADAANAVTVTVRQGTISAPNSSRAGWIRLRVAEVDGEHIVVAFRLPANSSPAAITAFIAALDTAIATPPPAVAIGGPEIGSQGEVIVNLAPASYVLACVRRGEDGHRHAISGESTVLHVRRNATDSALASPTGTHTIQLADFAYVGADQWASGAQLLRVENTGKQDHQLRLARLRDGATLQTWMSADDPNTVATNVAGMARLGAGEVAYLPVTLTPGSYVVYCLVADPNSKRQHVELGMMRAIQVK